MPGQEYYQVAGWRGHIQPPGNPRYGGEGALAEALFGSRSPLRPSGVTQGPIELVLGIRRSGASSLLMTVKEGSDYDRIFRARIRGPPLQASEFLSLSPIHFETAEELKKKLASLSPSKKKGGGGDRDMSQANSRYSDESMEEGIRRGEYELNRVFYRLAQGALNCPKYSLPANLRLPQGTRVCVITFSPYSKRFDTRTQTERRDNPKPLDIAFAEANPQTFELNNNTLQEFIVQDNRSLGNQKFRTATGGNTPETLPLSDIGSRLSAFLNAGTGPTVLLVYNKIITQSVLRALGCQPPVGSSMREVFLPLVKNAQPSTNGRDRWGSPPRRSGDYGRGSNGRSRSRSPTRASDPRRRPSDSRQDRRDESTPARQFVYVDVHELYHKMSTLYSDPDERPLDISGSLGVYKRRAEIEWGAGLEVGVILGCWKVMASGPAIDEMSAKLRSLSSGSTTPLPNPTPTPAAADGEDEDEYDEDRDPNDDIEEVEAATALHAANQKMKSYTRDPDYLSSDEDEY